MEQYDKLAREISEQNLCDIANSDAFRRLNNRQRAQFLGTYLCVMMVHMANLVEPVDKVLQISYDEALKCLREMGIIE